MGRLRGAELQALLGFLRTLSVAGDLEAFRRRLSTGMATLVAADLTTYFEIDPRRGRILAMIHSSSAFGAVEEQAFSRYMHQNPLLRSYRRGEGSAVKISDFMTRPEFQRLSLYNECFRRVGIEHQMAKGLPGPRELVTGIALHRRGRDFGESDRLLLNLLRPHLNEAYRSAGLMTGMREELNLLRHGLEEVDRGLVVVDAGGRVRLMTTRARQWIVEYFGRMPRRGLPDALSRWIAYDRALLDSAGMLATPRAPLLAEREGRRLEVRMVFDGDQRLLLLNEHPTTPDASVLEGLGLSRRQAEVLAWIAEGKTNLEIATILGMSYRTVEKHVQNILERLGVETRTAAAARALVVPR